jgi:hypothetical protein
MTQISRSRIVRNSSITEPSHGRPTPAYSIDHLYLFSNAHNPAAWLRDAADESAQPMLDRKSPFNLGPSDTLKKAMKRLFGQILDEH